MKFFFRNLKFKEVDLKPEVQTKSNEIENKYQSFCTFRNFLYSDGDFPIFSLNWRLKLDILLKPVSKQTKAMVSLLFRSRLHALLILS
jgi:hypothetical protein